MVAWLALCYLKMKGSMRTVASAERTEESPTGAPLLLRQSVMSTVKPEAVSVVFFQAVGSRLSIVSPV